MVFCGTEMSACEVFLGGACGATTWRDLKAIPELMKNGVSYYNPQCPEGAWHEGMIAEETTAKAKAAVMLFVISGETRGVASLVEASALIASGKHVCLVVEDIEMDAIVEGQHLGIHERKDLNRGRRYLVDVLQESSQNGCGNACLCKNVADAAAKATEMVLERRKFCHNVMDKLTLKKRSPTRLLRKASL